MLWPHPMGFPNINNKEIYQTIWEEIAEISSITHFPGQEGGSIKIETDWNPILKAGKKIKFSPTNLKIIPIKLKMQLSTTFDLDLNLYNPRFYLSDYLEMFIYNLFLIANLSIPGSFDPYGLSYSIQRKFIKSINLSPHNFEKGYEVMMKEKWPKFEYISFKVSKNWYDSIKIETKQIAENRLERCLFAILHACAGKSYITKQFVMAYP